jgi:Icc protein
MLIAQISDTHIKAPGRMAYGRVDTAAMLERCVADIVRRDPQPDLVVITGDLVDLGQAEEYAHLNLLLKHLRQPVIAVPGNHDEREAMRQALADHAHLSKQGFLHFSIDDRYPLRIVGLDTVVPGKGHGELCNERLTWLEATLSRHHGRPTLLLMHHPPFLTGIEHMDCIGLEQREQFLDIVARHHQVVAILCGHLHRNIQTQIGGRRALTCPSPAHQVDFDLRPGAPSRFRMEPPGYLMHWWNGEQLVSHSVILGEHEGPFPFFDDAGRLID